VDRGRRCDFFGISSLLRLGLLSSLSNFRFTPQTSPQRRWARGLGLFFPSLDQAVRL
jgi:hypothetical protein